MEKDNLIASIDDASLRPALGGGEAEPGRGLLTKALTALDAAADSLVECIIEGLADHAHATCSFLHRQKTDDARWERVAAAADLPQMVPLDWESRVEPRARE